MDKSWINDPNTFSKSYIKGVESFLNFAKENVMGFDNLIHCPCRSCNNTRFKTLEGVRRDLHTNGFSYNYPDWIFHGERVHIFSDSENEIEDTTNNNVLNDKSLNDDLDEMLDEIGEMRQPNNDFHGMTNSFTNLLKDAKRELYPGFKFPDGVAGNISRCIKANKISGLKSHDCHILLQRLIPAGVRGYLSKEVNEAIFELGEFFGELCSKTLKVENIERYLGTLKGFVRNRARPEGSIAEGYIVKECLTFMSMYVNGIETKFNRRRRNYDGPQYGDLEGLSVFSMRVRPFGHIRPEPILSDEELEKAHRFVLSNCDEVEHYLNTYKAELLGITLEEASEFELHDGQMKQFPEWFKEHMNSLHLRKDVEATEETVLFECEWFDTGSKKTTQVDRHFISIDVSSRWYKNDPFVLPIQVQQVFYINDVKFGKNWQLVQRVQHRHLWELPELDIEDDCDGSQTHAMSPLQQFESIGVSQVVEGVALTNLAREDVEPVILDENTYKEIWHARHLQDEADEELHSEEGPGAGGLKRIRNMQSSKNVLNSSSATVVKRKLLASNSSPPTSPIQKHSQDRHGLSLGQNLTTRGIQNDLEQNIGSSSTKPRESDGLKRIRLMRSSKNSLNYSKNPSLSESTSQAHSQGYCFKCRIKGRNTRSGFFISSKSATADIQIME
ncbi:hypothetical protein BUALT_Bualt06G0121900 [Buddleja alternifolia]|uniref:Transposase-associated domain-containing protein n=1 Tax=Buddleja alternifolia TaxID=168488 RepID=A0AAV6XN25_9LAMI|nr:hypothetical protein BUALT_Bualt06G0121900 [Buddleja alternifolia]